MMSDRDRDKEITERLMSIAKNDWLGWESILAKQINMVIHEHDIKIRKYERAKTIEDIFALRGSGKRICMFNDLWFSATAIKQELSDDT